MAWAASTAHLHASFARQACGGHDYLAISGLPDIIAALDATCTFEGEKTVMYLQLARYLMRVRGRPNGQSNVSGTQEVYDTLRDSTNLDNVPAMISRPPLVRMLSSRSVRQTKLRKHDAKIYALLLVLEEFQAQISRLSAPAERDSLKFLCRLFALSHIRENSTSLASLTDAQANQIDERIAELLAILSPNAIALIDAWNFSDGSLRSALGMRDGNVYGTIIQWVKQLPMNTHAGPERQRKRRDTYIKPAFRAKL